MSPLTRRAGPFSGLALAAALGLGLGLAKSSGARQFQIGELSGSLDTTLSIGAAVRVEDRDSSLVYTGHGGSNDSSFFINADDGNLNFDPWDFTSIAGKATMELELQWRNVGAFFRGTAFYDAIANDHELKRTELDRDARYRSSIINSGVSGLGFLLLDAYVFGSFEPAERSLELRLGSQFLSWGESLFTPGGISQTNAVDVTRLRTPGSELKEAFLPAPMFWASFEPVESFGIEAYYQFYWNRTAVDPTGTYFSFNDLVGRGADGLFFPAVDGTLTPIPTEPADPGGRGVDADELTDFPCVPLLASCGIPRLRDDKPSNQGQFGVALRYYSDRLRSEFGLYYIHFHGKQPGVGFDAVGFAGAALLEGYFREYPEDVNLYGFSVATEILNVAVAAEISYRPDDPVPIRANGIAFDESLTTGMPATASGFVTENRLQAQLNMIWTLGPGTRLLGPMVELLGADDIQVIGEVALVDYDLTHGEEFEPITARVVPFNPDLAVDYAGPTLEHRVTEFSWGYQLLIQPTYTNPWDLPITLTPRIGFQHDVNGTTPGLLPFIENRKAMTVGIEVDYLNTWGLDLAYSSFFGGGSSNLLNDRDFVSFSLSYSF